MQPDVHNEPVLVQIQLLYSVHQNDKDNKLKIVFHQMKIQFHHIKRDTKLVVKFLRKQNKKITIIWNVYFHKINNTLDSSMTI